jgi:hypothetical protein
VAMLFESCPVDGDLVLVQRETEDDARCLIILFLNIMQSLTKKYRSMPFMVRYAELFEKSNIIEQIIPRKMDSAKDFQFHYPDLLIKGSSQIGPDMEVSKEDEYE